ncbi:MAG: P-type conjugative transfer protein TrbG [Sphingopyxis sp.]|nr:MAG: P-type conjugative transfer protein TrbG [Sphingopyxis sp.]
MKHSALALIAAVLLSACSGRNHPAQTVSAIPMQAAELVSEARTPIPLTKLAVPMSLPSQFTRIAEEKPGMKKPAPAARVNAANRSALQEPETHGFIKAVQIYPFVEGTVYKLYAAPERVSDIALQAGETLTSVAAGDTVRWIVGDTTSGSGTARRTHILVKPSAPGLTTNLLITTDRRIYYLQLESTETTSMAALSWNYPQDELLAIKRAQDAAEMRAPIAGGLNIENLHFGYEITGDHPAWRPIRVFDDGRQVFIAFPESIATGEAPPLFVSGPKGQTQLVNYRMRGNYYIVDRLFQAAELRLGTKPQSIVRISRGTTKKSKRREKGS